MRKTREERKRERSEKSSRAAILGWQRIHEAKAAAGVLELYPAPRPNDLYRITIENLQDGGRTHTLLLHPGPRSDNYAIDKDGVPWKTGGFSIVMQILRKSLVKTKMNYVSISRPGFEPRG